MAKSLGALRRSRVDRRPDPCRPSRGGLSPTLRPEKSLKEAVLAASKQTTENIWGPFPFQEQHRLQFLSFFFFNLTREKNTPEFLGEIQRQLFPPYFEEVLNASLADVGFSEGN